MVLLTRAAGCVDAGGKVAGHGEALHANQRGCALRVDRVGGRTGSRAEEDRAQFRVGDAGANVVGVADDAVRVAAEHRVDIGACDADFGGTAGGFEFKTVGAFECGEAGDV
jgi:hypothetical protein